MRPALPAIGPRRTASGGTRWRPGSPGRQVLPRTTALWEVVVGQRAGLVLPEGDRAEAVGRFARQGIAGRRGLVDAVGADRRQRLRHAGLGAGERIAADGVDTADRHREVGRGLLPAVVVDD